MYQISNLQFKYPIYCSIYLKEITKSVSHHCVCLMRCVQEVAGLKEEDLSTDTGGSSHTTGSVAVSSVDLSNIPDGTQGEWMWLCKHTIITSVII